MLEALAEIAFAPQFFPGRIEKERRAVMAEAQMMNSIEYRVDCQLLQFLHEENALGCRFPIGKMEQVARWGREALLEFWGDWYFPANATLYLVGQLDRPLDDARALIDATFGKLPPGRARAAPPGPAELAEAARAIGGAAPAGHADARGAAGNGAAPAADALPPLKQRHAVRPLAPLGACGAQGRRSERSAALAARWPPRAQGRCSWRPGASAAQQRHPWRALRVTPAPPCRTAGGRGATRARGARRCGRRCSTASAAGRRRPASRRRAWPSSGTACCSTSC